MSFPDEGIAQSAYDRYQEGAAAAGRFQDLHGREVLVRGVPDRIQHEVRDPLAGVHGAFRPTHAREMYHGYIHMSDGNRIDPSSDGFVR